MSISFNRVGLFSMTLLGISVGISLVLLGGPRQVLFSDLISPSVELLATASLFAASKRWAPRSKRPGMGLGRNRHFHAPVCHGGYCLGNP